MQKIGPRIQQLRKQRGLTQVKLAEAAHLNYRHLQEVESSRANIHLSTAEEIARALDVPTHFLLNDKMDPKILDMGIECYGELLDHLPVGIFIFDITGKIVYRNRYFQERLTHLPAEAFSRGVNISEIVVKEHRPTTVSKLREIPEKRPVPTSKRYTYRGPGDAPIETVVTWKYIENEEGKVKGYFAVAMPAGQIYSATPPESPK